MKKILFTILTALIFIPLSISAQTDPTAVLEYFEDPYGDMMITDETGDILDYFDIGEVLPPGFSISTGGGIAEIRLNPNGTILKLAEDTDFSITNLQGYKGSPSNEFSLLAGKMRTIAARTSGLNYYNVRTPSAVMGVRGTDFINEVGSDNSSVVVRQGLVEVIPFSGSPVTISKNQSVDTLADVFRAVNVPLEQVESLFRSMDFKALNPADIPGHIPMADNQETDESAEKPADESSSETAEIPLLTDEDMADAQSGTPSDSKPDNMDSPIAKILRDIFGMEIGTTTIDGKTWSKVILQPTINTGKLKIGLYLPVIYVDNMFDSAQWYEPQGNNEWSFGTDQNKDDVPEIILDIIKDLMLKIKFIEYGDQGWDKFYLKVGNLNNMSIGHGTIMDNYANDSEFPAIRKVGLNIGFDLGAFGMEFVGDNLADLSITGGRLFVSPFKGYEPFQIGLTGIVDLFPARKSDTPENYGDPWLLAFGMDLEFFKINKDNFKIMLFGDFSTMMPVFREAPDLSVSGISAGAASEIFLDDGSFRNFGVIAGLRGSIAKFTWAFEYRLSTGIYKPSIYNAVYDRNKLTYLSEIISYLDSPSSKGVTMGIYGEGGYVLKDKLAFMLGYYLPWEINDGSVEISSDDHFKASIVFMRGLVPRIPIHGSISYERMHLIDTFKGEGDLTAFDANTVVSGEIIYPIAPTLDIVFGVSTVIQTDSSGEIMYKSDDVTPEISPVINIETRIHF